MLKILYRVWPGFNRMQLFTNLFLLSHQLCLTSGLRVLDNGLGLPGNNEESIVDYALLASDQKAALPSQVQKPNQWWNFAYFAVHHLLVCSFGCFDNSTLLLSNSPTVWDSLDRTVHGNMESIQINGKLPSLGCSFVRDGVLIVGQFLKTVMYKGKMMKFHF